MIYFVEYYHKDGAIRGLPQQKQFSDLQDARDFALKKSIDDDCKVTISQVQDNQEICQAKAIEFL